MISLGILGRFKHMKTLVEQLADSRRQLDVLREKNSQLADREREAHQQNVNLVDRASVLVAQNTVLASRYEDLEQKFLGLSLTQQRLEQECEGFIETIDKKSNENVQLSIEYQKVLHQFDASRWLVKNASGIMLLLDKKSLVDLHVFYHDRWEQDRLEYLLGVIKLVKDATTQKIYFFDVGSYFGQYSLVIKTDFPDMEVISFEANPYNFIQLRSNLLLNAYVDKITTFNRCVTDVPGRTSVSEPDADNRGAAMVGSAYEGDESSIFVVENLVVDIQFAAISNAIIVMKMDIEGSEPKALNGMKQLFARNKVFLQIEDWDFPEGETSRILKDMNCSLVRGMHPDYFYANFDVQDILGSDAEVGNVLASADS